MLDHQEVIKYMKAFTDAQTSRHFGVSREYIRQLRNKYKIPPPEIKQICHVNSWTEELKVSIFNYLEGGLAPWEIAEKTGKSTNQIHTFLRVSGVDLKKYNYKQKPAFYPQSKPEELNKARDMYKEGYTLYQIYKKLDVSIALPYKWKQKGLLD